VARADRALLLRLAASPHFEQAVKSLPEGGEAAWRFASRYVSGRSLGDALDATAGLLRRGHGVSVDLFGERVDDPAIADSVVEDYLALAAALPPTPADVWLSVDLSHLAMDAGVGRAARRLARVACALPHGRRLQVGAEDAAHTDKVLACIVEVAERGLADRLGGTLQANLLRSTTDVRTLIDAGVHIRLVKGAYLESVGAHPHGEATDVAYLRLAFQLFEGGAAWSMATHDGRLREALLLAGASVTVEQLLGVRPEVLDELRGRGVHTRVYLPYGPNWFRYWMRRVAESRRA
jgi:proline dehydrogenase